MLHPGSCDIYEAILVHFYEKLHSKNKKKDPKQDIPFPIACRSFLFFLSFICVISTEDISHDDNSPNSHSSGNRRYRIGTQTQQPEVTIDNVVERGRVDGWALLTPFPKDSE